VTQKQGRLRCLCRGDWGVGFQISLAKPNRGGFGTPKNQGILTLGSPSVRPRSSVSRDALLALQRGRVMLWLGLASVPGVVRHREG
jgi:hypothetical protein